MMTLRASSYLLIAALSLASQSVLAFEGFLEPQQTVDIAAAETGVLRKINVSEGAEVKAGDVLAVLDSRLIEASLKVAKAKKNSTATILGASAEWEVSKNKLAQFTKLYTAGNARKDELVRAELEEKIAAAKLSRAREQKKILELEYQRILMQIEHRIIRSPVNGVVVTVNREAGELVSASHGPFIRIVDISQMKFITNVPQEDVRKISRGHEISIELDEGGENLTGIVEHVSPIIDPTSDTVKVSVSLENPGGVRSGSAGRLLLQ